MSQRLTSSTRTQIATAVLRHRFSDEIEALVSDFSDLAEDVYNDFYRKADRDRMTALAEGWLPTSSNVSAKFGEAGSCYASIRFDGVVYGDLGRLRKPASKNRQVSSHRVLEKHRNGCWKVYATEHKLSIRYQAIRDREGDLKSRVAAAETQINAALSSISTVAALLKAWPEIEPFAKAFVSVPAPLPAIPISTLNATFKLPVREAA